MAGKSEAGPTTAKRRQKLRASFSRVKSGGGDAVQMASSKSFHLRDRSGCFLFSTLRLAGQEPGTSQEPSLILHNGKVLTVDNNFSVAEAVAIRGREIAAVGRSHPPRFSAFQIVLAEGAERTAGTEFAKEQEIGHDTQKLEAVVPPKP